MSLNLQLPASQDFNPKITVFGVGGAGGNAVNNMITSNLQGVSFVVANTDAQALEYSKADHRIQLGDNITRGLGAGASPDIGSAAAEESIGRILEHLADPNMVFITGGMGGGTGTGAAPVIAKAAREQGILTVGVVTKPFHFEGAHRMKIAELGIEELQRYVDTLIVIPNQNLFRIATEKTTFADAFKLADNVLHSGVRGVTDLIMMPGLINLDFADIRTVMTEMGKAMMGTGEAEGENRAMVAAEAAISNPLLDNVSMKGARGVLINITGGGDMTLFEVDEAANRIREEVEVDANIIFGSTFNEAMDGKIRVSVIATGIEPAGGSTSRTPNTRHPAKAQAAAPVQQTASQRQAQINASRPIQQEREVYESPRHAAVQNTPSRAVEQFLDEEEEEDETETSSRPGVYTNALGKASFIPPSPVEPEGYDDPAYAQSEYEEETDEDDADFEEYDEASEGDENQSGSFFDRMTGGRFKGDKVSSSVMESPVRQSEPRTRPSRPEQEKVLVEETTGGDYKDDLFDIPAFLRRKNTN
ncbi:MAG: mitochondrial division protein fszA-like [Rickettsiales bacterium]|jgi:cell division protein FtsZ|nr:mitochondrial division protein fszA-like [Rickettsiales bacterium]